MKLIAEKQIKSGTKFKDLTDNNYADDSNIYRYENNNFIGRWGGTNILLLLKHDFEILEDEEEIERLDPNKAYFKDGTELVYELMYSKINELVENVNKLEKNKVDYIQPYKED